MRPRLRSAYLSIRRNMKRLWTFYDYRDRVIPNTNNGLEAIFADIKSKVRVHSGLTGEHRMKDSFKIQEKVYFCKCNNLEYVKY